VPIGNLKCHYGHGGYRRKRIVLAQKNYDEAAQKQSYFDTDVI